MATNGDASIAGLGTFEREYRVSKVMAISGLVFGIGSLLMGILMLVLTIFKLDSTATSTGSQIGQIVGAVFFFVVGGGMLWFLFISRNSGIKVYGEGMVVTQRGKEKIFPWGEISALYVDVVKVTVNGKETMHRKYEIRRHDGEKVILTHLIKQVEEIAQRVETETYQRMFPGWLASLRKSASSEGLAFEPFRLRSDALLHNSESLLIGQISNVEVNDGKIVIGQRDAGRPWATVAYSKVPNAAVFLGLLAALRTA